MRPDSLLFRVSRAFMAHAVLYLSVFLVTLRPMRFSTFPCFSCLHGPCGSLLSRVSHDFITHAVLYFSVFIIVIIVILIIITIVLVIIILVLIFPSSSMTRRMKSKTGERHPHPFYLGPLHYPIIHVPPHRFLVWGSFGTVIFSSVPVSWVSA